MIITIDGPTASGKTTIARMLAKKLGFYYLSSGLLFRGLAYVLVHEYRYQEKDLYHPRKNDIQKIFESGRFIYRYDAVLQEQLFFDGKNITPFLKDEKISQYSSIVATDGKVREALASLQHQIADSVDLVAEGRDTGSTIFPHAQIKFFLTASLEVRAQRFAFDQKVKGKLFSFEQARQEVEKRDLRDLNRTLAPLCIPKGAEVIDDTALHQEQVIALMEKAIEPLLKK